MVLVSRFQESPACVRGQIVDNDNGGTMSDEQRPTTTHHDVYDESGRVVGRDTTVTFLDHHDKPTGVPMREQANAVAELAALKARRCDGCKHSAPDRRWNGWMPQPGYVWCYNPATHEMNRDAVNVRPDHACNAWEPKQPQNAK